MLQGGLTGRSRAVAPSSFGSLIGVGDFPPRRTFPTRPNGHHLASPLHARSAPRHVAAERNFDELPSVLGVR